MVLPLENGVGESGISDIIMIANLGYTTDDGHWYFRAGKGFMFVGSAEQWYLPNEVNVYSIVGNNLSVYNTGVTAQYTNDNGHIFCAQIVNAKSDSLGNMANLQYNVYWYGHIIKDRIKTFVNFAYLDDTQICILIIHIHSMQVYNGM